MKFVPFRIACFITALSCFLVSCHSSKPHALEELNVVVIVVDTLAARYLGAYSETIDSTPELDSLAKQSVVFERAYSTAPWTKPSITSLLTSLYPSEHGVTGLNTIKSDKLHTMPEFLAERGFRSHGVVSHTLIDSKNGFADGFDSYELVPLESNVHYEITSHKVSDRALEILSEHASQKERSGEGLFLFLHYFDPHFNYQHHADFDQTSGYEGRLTPGVPFRRLKKLFPGFTREDMRYLVGLYREEIAYTDHHIGRVLKRLQEEPFAKNTLIVFTADHGEEFGEHGNLGHTRTLFDELVKVPLFVSLPERFQPKRVSVPVSTVDVLPTILALSKKPYDQELRGVSLLEALEGKQLPPLGRELWAEVDFKSSGVEARKVGVFVDDQKGIFDRMTNLFELYDVRKDPDEKNNIADQSPELAAKFKAKIDHHLSRYVENQQGTPTEEIERTPEEVKQLESLGYM